MVARDSRRRRDAAAQRRDVRLGAAALTAGCVLGLAGVARVHWRRLAQAPAETDETWKNGLRVFRAPAGQFELFARAQRAGGGHLPPLLLLHGLVVSSKVMEPLMGRLAHRFRLLAPDLPGYGESSKPPALPGIEAMADTLAAWLHGMGIGRTHVFGLSFGCNVAATLAARHPALVERLVLQGPGPDPRGRHLPVTLWRDFANEHREPRSSWPIAKVDYAKIGLRRAVAAVRLALDTRIETIVPHVPVPTLVVTGARDVVAPAAWAGHLARLLPDGRLLVLPDTAHVLPYGAPDRLAAAMLPFLTNGAG